MNAGGTYDGPERRAIDPIQNQIETLILEAEEPKDKALLLILNKMASSLDANTELTRSLSMELKSHTGRFELHEKKELSLLNRGRGFILGALAVLGLTQALLIYIAKTHLADVEVLVQTVNNLQISMAEHKEHHRQEERFRDGPKLQETKNGSNP